MPNLFFRNSELPTQRSCPCDMTALRSANKSASSIKCVVNKITFQEQCESNSLCLIKWSQNLTKNSLCQLYVFVKVTRLIGENKGRYQLSARQILKPTGDTTTNLNYSFIKKYSTTHVPLEIRSQLFPLTVYVFVHHLNILRTRSPDPWGQFPGEHETLHLLVQMWIFPGVK